MELYFESHEFSHFRDFFGFFMDFSNEKSIFWIFVSAQVTWHNLELSSILIDDRRGEMTWCNVEHLMA